MQTPFAPLPREFYEPSASVVAPLLLGHHLIRQTPDGQCGGLIVETEAYLFDDPACHAYKRQTPRNRAMWGPPGHAYVYLIYGYHFCFNAVCQPQSVAEAVLVRAIEPNFGLEQMQRNRAAPRPADLTNGPAKFCAAMKIDLALDGVDICDAAAPLFIARNDAAEETRARLGPVVTTTRIGISRAAEWPLRFYLDGSRFVSRRVPRAKLRRVPRPKPPFKTSMEEQIRQLEERAAQQIEAAASPAEIEAARLSLLGKKGELTALLRGMGGVAAEDRPRIGQLVNDARGRIESTLEARAAQLATAAREARLADETIDVTLPAAPLPFGKRHPLTQTLDDIVRIFSNLGYGVVEGPEIETAHYNFDALGIGPDHPARERTIYISNNVVLRTETSAVQIRTMEARQPPVKVIAPGRVYRREATDRTHSTMFQQVEGLLVDRDISFGDLKGTLTTFLQQLFDALPDAGDAHGGLRIRFRPQYFPFTEPSAEFDMGCIFCGGAGCATCKRTGWIELGGCGMVHPQVLENVGYDSEKYTGFAFGFGIERLAMLKFGIDDLRLFYENDIRFLQQF